LALLLAATACSGDSGVRWGDYPADLRSTIDVLVRARECATLHAMSDAAATGTGELQAPAGGSNDELVVYIEAKIRAADC